MQKFNDDDDYVSGSDKQSKYFNSTLLRSEHEFYKEEEDITYKVINVRKAKMRKSNDWEILEDGKVVLVLKGVRFTNAEKEYFKTVEGMKFIVDGYKNGWNSVSKFKEGLKEILK